MATTADSSPKGCFCHPSCLPKLYRWVISAPLDHLTETGQLTASEPHKSQSSQEEGLTGLSSIGEMYSNSPLTMVQSYVLGSHTCSWPGHFGLWLHALTVWVHGKALSDAEGLGIRCPVRHAVDSGGNPGCDIQMFYANLSMCLITGTGYERE